MGKNSAVFRKCLSIQSCLGKNVKIDFFGDKMVLSVFFIEVKFRSQTGLANFNKHQALKILISVDFYAFFLKISHFPRFLIFISGTSSKC